MMIIIGHRGAAAHAPENTFASFELARKFGCESIETDIHRTKDGVLVLIHDPTVDRTTNGMGKVAEMTYSELAQLDAGSWFSTRYSQERIPTLAEFLQRYAGRVHLTLEIKAHQIESQFIEAVETAGLAETDFTVISFSLDTLKNIKSLRPTFDAGYLVSSIDRTNLATCVESGFTYICPQIKHTSAQDVAAAQQLGIKVRVWGVYSEESMHQAAGLDIAGLTLDFPDKYPRKNNSDK